MSYRLLALDLDGTLLRRDHSVDPRDAGAIRELAAAGVTVTIVTGRLVSGSTTAARACGIEGAIGCVEGSHLFELGSGRTLAHHPIPEHDAQRLRSWFEAHRLATFAFDADGIHHDHAAEPYAAYAEIWSPNLRVVEETVAWRRDLLALVAIGEQRDVAGVHALAGQHADSLFCASFPVFACPGKHAILIRAAGTTKGTALDALCREAGCALAESVAIGDWFNDVPMFEVAGRSFVMAGSPEPVSCKATDRLESAAGGGGGIAEAIRRVWG